MVVVVVVVQGDAGSDRCPYAQPLSSKRVLLLVPSLTLIVAPPSGSVSRRDSQS